MACIAIGLGHGTGDERKIFNDMVLEVDIKAAAYVVMDKEWY